MKSKRILVKICGLTRVEEAAYVNQYHADLAGMVLFFPQSSRNLTISQAEAVMHALNPIIQKVAVVVSPNFEQIRQIEAAGFDYIQIHGELSSDIISAVHLPILKAYNVTDMKQYEKYQQYPQIVGYVLDAQEPGSGKTFDWKLAEQIPRDGKLLFLAGGLNPENVKQAIVQVHPDGVDVSSGVEYDHSVNGSISGRVLSNPGKDPIKIKRFIENVRSG